MPRAKATKKATPKKKRETPVAPKSKTYVMYKSGSDGYSYGNVQFYGAAAVKAAKLTATRIKEIAQDLLAGRKPHTGRPSGTSLGSTCPQGLRSVMGLSPKAGRIYKVTATYEVEDITETAQAESKALVKDLEATIKKHTPKPAAKTATKSKSKRVTKKATKSKRAKRKINRYVAP